MEKEINLEFDYMRKDKVVANVKVYSDRSITCERFTNNILDNPLPLGCNSKSLLIFLETRCFPRTRANCDELLNLLGLKYYDPLAIVHKTHGRMYDDFYWVRFKGETLEWKDVNPRLY